MQDRVDFAHILSKQRYFGRYQPGEMGFRGYRKKERSPPKIGDDRTDCGMEEKDCRQRRALMTPQPMRSPASPAGWLVKSSRRP